MATHSGNGLGVSGRVVTEGGDPRTTGFLDRLYDAALEPAQWPGVLADFAGMVGGEGAALLFQNQDTGNGDGLFVGIDPAAKPLYFGRFRMRNVVMLKNDQERLRRNFVPRVITDQDVLPKDELLRSDYYNDFLKPFGVHSVLMVGLAVRGVSAATLNIVRPGGRPDYAAPEVRVARAIQPHLIRAYGLGLKLGERSPVDGALADVLDGSPHGVLVLDAAGRVRHLNPAAEAILARADGLELSRGALVAATTDVTRALQALVAAAGDPDAALRRGGSVALPRPSQASPLLVTVAPARTSRLSVFGAGPAVIVSVTDPEAAVDLPEPFLRQLFGLTPAEARVALKLLEGCDPRQAAAALGLSFYTVRAHLVRIFGKTGTGRQAELVRLLMRASGVHRA